MARFAPSRQSLHWITSSISSRRFLSSCGLRSLPNPSLNPNPSTNTGSPCGLIFPLHRWRGISPHGNMSFSTDGSQENRSTPQPQQASSSPTFDDPEPDTYQQYSSVRRRPYNLEAKMRMKQYRREASHRQRALEIEEEERNFQLDYSKMYKKGDEGTMQGVVKEINTVGYFMKLPNGREGFLPCSQLECMGGIPLLSRLFKVGDEITVRAEIVGDGGKDRLYCKP